MEVGVVKMAFGRSVVSPVKGFRHLSCLKAPLQPHLWPTQEQFELPQPGSLFLNSFVWHFHPQSVLCISTPTTDIDFIPVYLYLSSDCKTTSHKDWHENHSMMNGGKRLLPCLARQPCTSYTASVTFPPNQLGDGEEEPLHPCQFQQQEVIFGEPQEGDWS